MKLVNDRYNTLVVRGGCLGVRVRLRVRKEVDPTPIIVVSASPSIPVVIGLICSGVGNITFSTEACTAVGCPMRTQYAAWRFSSCFAFTSSVSVDLSIYRYTSYMGANRVN